MSRLSDFQKQRKIYRNRFPELTQERLRQICRYDPITGNLIWREAGKKRIIGTTVGSVALTGYLETSIEYRRYLVHRLVWFWHHGTFPREHTDHINHCRTDNRIENLRAVTNQQNNFNQSKRSKSTSSKWRGVSRNTKLQLWRAAIKVEGHQKFLGYYTEEEDAALAWNFAAVEYYGEFANLNNTEVIGEY